MADFTLKRHDLRPTPYARILDSVGATYDLDRHAIEAAFMYLTSLYEDMDSTQTTIKFPVAAKAVLTSGVIVVIGGERIYISSSSPTVETSDYVQYSCIRNYGTASRPARILAPNPIYGLGNLPWRLSGNAEFSIQSDHEGVADLTVTVLAYDTASNNSYSDLLDNVNAALVNIGMDSYITASLQENRLLFTSATSNDATRIIIRDPNTVAALELGIGDELYGRGHTSWANATLETHSAGAETLIMIAERAGAKSYSNQGAVLFPLKTGDTTVSGQYLLEFELFHRTEYRFTIPGDTGRIKIEIVDDLDNY